MIILCLKEDKDLLAMASSVRWYSHVLRREDGHVLRRVLDFEVEVQGKKDKRQGQGGHGKSRLWKKYEGLLAKERCTLPF